MKKVIALLLLLILGFSGPLYAAQRVRGYTKSNGTYVAPYYRSSPDSSRSNNYSASGNVNPYTGRRGYKKY